MPRLFTEMPHLITENMDIWTTAEQPAKAGGRGRAANGNGNKSPYGIQKLRELILELAVRGKLVPQDSNDEPASELLKKIAAEKARLIKAKAIRKTKKPAAFDSDVLPIPDNWAYSTLYDLGEIGPRIDAPDETEASFVPMTMISEKYGVRVQSETKKWGEIKSGFTHFGEGDVVLAKITPCFQNGKSCVMRGLKNGIGAGTTELHVFRPIGGFVHPEYVLLFLKSPSFIQDGIPRMTGSAGQKRITRDYFAGKPFPLPPLEEQRRIVAKVDELMALCDRLEQEQAESGEAHRTLVETLLGTLTQVKNNQELAEAWRRIAGHFDILFTTEQSIDQLKQTILQLAVMGKLVPQDPNDEPASELLKKIAAEKARLIKEGKIKKQKPLPPIDEGEMPFELSEGWKWAYLNDIGDWGAGATPNRRNTKYYGGEIPWFKSGELVGDFISESEEHVTDLALKECSLRYNKPGDVLIAMYGATIGKTSILSVPGTTNQAVCACTPFTGVFNRYLLTILKAYKHRFTSMGAGGAQPNISREKIIATVIALPPETEQHRIVAKVDELMALCDALKARLGEARATRVHLADAIVEQAVSRA